MIKKYSILIISLFLLSKAERTVAQSFRAPGRSNQQDVRSNFNNNNIENTDRMHKIETIKSGYLSENMHLNTEEADKFWPVYNQYQRELSTVMHQKRQNMLNSQKNAQDIVNDNFEYDSKILSIKKHYNDEFGKILPSDKLAQFYKSQIMFNEEMIKRLKNRRDNE